VAVRVGANGQNIAIVWPIVSGTTVSNCWTATT
jgi:hypothetical protein